MWVVMCFQCSGAYRCGFTDCLYMKLRSKKASTAPCKLLNETVSDISIPLIPMLDKNRMS